MIIFFNGSEGAFFYLKGWWLIHEFNFGFIYFLNIAHLILVTAWTVLIKITVIHLNNFFCFLKLQFGTTSLIFANLSQEHTQIKIYFKLYI